MEFSSSGGNQSDTLHLKKMKKRKSGIYEKIGGYMGQRSNQDYSHYGTSSSKSLKNIKCVESSSEEYLNEKMVYKYERGQSVDYGQVEKKRSSWFHRESHSTEHTMQRKAKEKPWKQQQYSPKRHTIERTEKYVLEQLKSHLKNKDMRLEANTYATSDCTTPEDDRNCYLSSGKSTEDVELTDLGKHKESSSRFQMIGKRFLKGEIGIKSFNYYLIKEGLKSTKKGDNAKQQVPPATNSSDENTQSRKNRKMEENIYEEIFFLDKNRKMGSSHRKRDEQHWKFKDECELCVQEQCTNENCEICNANCLNEKLNRQHQEHCYSSYGRRTKGGKMMYDYHSDDGVLENKYAEIGPFPGLNKSPGSDGITRETDNGQPVLQFQSYNPNNPGVYKIETTPIAVTGDYHPFEKNLDQYRPPNMQNIYQEIKSSSTNPRGKSSSSSDSINQHRNNSQKNKFTENIYSKPIFNQSSSRGMVPNNHRHPHYPVDPKIYKAHSDASILSEVSNRSEVSMNKYKIGSEMSDSSIGDSLFSYSNHHQRRYFGSSESCRYGSDCQRCLERCNYYSEDNNNYCHHCDCSSSYFSSDFDDTTNLSRKSSTRVSLGSDPSRKSELLEGSGQHFYDYPKKKNAEPKYGEDFMRHLNNVKNSAFDTDNSYYSKPNLKPVPVGHGELAGKTGGISEERGNGAKINNQRRHVKKKYYYDDIMTIPNEVAYNLSYGMIRRDQQLYSQPLPKQHPKPGNTEIPPTIQPSNTIEPFRIYEEIKEKPLLPKDEGSDKDEDVQKETTTDIPEKVEPRLSMVTGTKPKQSVSSSCDELVEKPLPPIYASPVKVKKIVGDQPRGGNDSIKVAMAGPGEDGKLPNKHTDALATVEKQDRGREMGKNGEMKQNTTSIEHKQQVKANDEDDSIEDDVFSESKKYENPRLNNRKPKVTS